MKHRECFNRYMVECEQKICLSTPTTTRVLIDTWWNVNAALLLSSLRSECVLIDTWWNVNLDDSGNYAELASFNRYMVECEL